MIQAGRARQQMVEVVLSVADRFVTGEVTEHYGKFKSVHEYMDTVLPAKLSELFEKAVVKPLDDWAASVAELRTQAAEYESGRVKYDHYKDKFVQLQEEKRQTQMKGKLFPKDSEERLARNEEKLREATEAYNQTRDGFLGRALVLFVSARRWPWCDGPARCRGSATVRPSSNPSPFPPPPSPSAGGGCPHPGPRPPARDAVREAGVRGLRVRHQGV